MIFLTVINKLTKNVKKYACIYIHTISNEKYIPVFIEHHTIRL